MATRDPPGATPSEAALEGKVQEHTPGLPSRDQEVAAATTPASQQPGTTEWPLEHGCRKPAHFHCLPAREAAKMGAHCCLPCVNIQWKLICTWNPIASELEIWLSALRGLQRRRGDRLSTTLHGLLCSFHVIALISHSVPGNCFRNVSSLPKPPKECPPGNE